LLFFFLGGSGVRPPVLLYSSDDFKSYDELLDGCL